MEATSVIICGSRHWQDRRAIEERVAELPEGTLVIYGGAPGADQMAATAALARGLRLVCFAPDWGRFGRAAGPRRNREMLDLQPTLVIAFRLLGWSPGTDDLTREAERRGIPVEWHKARRGRRKGAGDA